MRKITAYINHFLKTNVKVESTRKEWIITGKLDDASIASNWFMDKCKLDLKEICFFPDMENCKIYLCINRPSL